MSFYTSIRTVNLVYFGIVLVSSLVLLYINIAATIVDYFYISISIGIILMSFLGAYGAYAHKKLYLLICAITVVVADIITSVSFSFLSILDYIFVILLLVQAELLRRGHQVV